MKNIKRIIKDDIISVTHNLFALIVAIGICILPALYAWFNIYANWDPYGNTGNLDLAAVSLDKGYVDDEGVYRNVGNEVIEDLKQSDSVRWHFVDTPEEAKEGVEAGDYYASIVISDNFTYNMYNVFTEKVNKPQLVFYENQKKNPVATKISDTVVEKIQTKINTKFVKVMTSEVFKDVNKISDDIEEEGGIDGLIDKMQSVSDEMKSYQNTINNIVAGNAILTAAINSANEDTMVMADKTYESANALSDTEDSINASQVTLNDYADQVNLVVMTIQTSLGNVSNKLNEALLLNDMKAINSAVKTVESDITLAKKDAQALEEALLEASKGDIPVADKAKIEAARLKLKTIQSSIDKVDGVITGLEKENVGDSVINNIEKRETEAKQRINDCIVSINDTQGTINSQLIPQLNECLDNLRIVINDASTLMYQMGSTLSGMDKVFSSLKTAVNAGNISLNKTAGALGEIDKRLSKVIDKVNKASNNEKVQILMDTLSGDPELYGQFFSEPVKIETTNIYPVENYGSAVAPFYTVLAIWVGAIILAAIVRSSPGSKKYPEMTSTERFFGRYGMYFIIGQLQALITVVGDLVFFKVQCLHPFLFYFATAFTSLTFTLIIYALVEAFGDVGKAIAVVILVIQIAGSSGTYPIELLPDFFKNVYLFFPFPYAINALRECVGGLYELDYFIYLLKLSLFIVLALVIGIWIRKPFKSLKKYMSKRMEDTEVL
ncbi:MAG: YhgE/Pip domain-containing protein [Lachnospiraceae bacterium]|nr:YhgE/Pip domain-containing protein [Lachnospiraceae bacterium]